MSEALQETDLRAAAEALEWFADRLVTVYGENPNLDYQHKARRLVEHLRKPWASTIVGPVVIRQRPPFDLDLD